MRTLTPSLLSAQEEYTLEPRIRITLSFDGEEDIVLTGGFPPQTGDRIKSFVHNEQSYSVYAKDVKLDNSDGYFTELDLKGWKAVVSWGLKTSEGNEYSDTSPMWVMAQWFDSSPGILNCYLTLKGIPDILDEDQANSAYLPTASDQSTVKNLIDVIAFATIDCFNHCKRFETVWEDGYDALADTYSPTKSFRIYKGGSRLASLKRLLEYTENVYRWGDDGKIHIFKPNTWGDDYDSEYSLDSGHTFFAKAYRHTLVIPNKVTVSSEPDDSPQYTGSAQVDDYALLPDEVTKTHYVELTVESNAEAASIAEAILARAEFNAEQGSASVPVNVSTELYDYIKVTDSRCDDVRTGNIGWLQRTWDAEEETWEMTFGFGDSPSEVNIRNVYSALNKTVNGNFDRFIAKHAYIEDLWIDKINAVWLDANNNIDLDKIGDTLDNLVNGTTYAKVKAASLSAEGLVLLDATVEGTYGKLLKSSLSAEGLALLDETVNGTYAKLLAGQISSGYIKLTSQSVKSGQWYKESGVEIDADAGIDLYGTDMAFTTSSAVGAITAFADAGGGEVTVTLATHGLATGDRVHISDTTNYNGNYIITVVNVNQFKITATWVQTETGTCRKVQTYSGSDGQIYAGAGAVTLSVNGLAINTASLTTLFRLYNGANNAYLYVDASGKVNLTSDVGQTKNTGIFTNAGNILPEADGTRNLGSAVLKFADVETNQINGVSATNLMRGGRGIATCDADGTDTITHGLGSAPGAVIVIPINVTNVIGSVDTVGENTFHVVFKSVVASIADHSHGAGTLATGADGTGDTSSDTAGGIDADTGWADGHTHKYDQSKYTQHKHTGPSHSHGVSGSTGSAGSATILGNPGAISYYWIAVL